MSTLDKTSENLKKYRDQLEELRADWTRSDQAKRQDLQPAYTEAPTAPLRGVSQLRGRGVRS
jgi:hypothetical protein